MCIIIAKPKGTIVPFEHVTNAAGINQDGIGISTRNGKPKVKIDKYLSLKAFRADYEAVLNNPDVEAVIHLRYATHGSVSLSNVHPFKTSHGYALHHNGVFTIQTEADKTDSECFKETYFDKVTADRVKGDVFKGFIEPIMERSKIALHTDTGILLFNESYGHWHEGVWYSNYGYESYDLGWERPSNRRRMMSTDVQLHRMHFRPSPSFMGFESLTENGKEIYSELCQRYGFDFPSEYVGLMEGIA